MMSGDFHCSQRANCLVLSHARDGTGARPFPGSGPDEELSLLMQKLRAAKPPAEVMKVCIVVYCSETPGLRHDAAKRHSCGPFLLNHPNAMT